MTALLNYLSNNEVIIMSVISERVYLAKKYVINFVFYSIIMFSERY